MTTEEIVFRLKNLRASGVELPEWSLIVDPSSNDGVIYDAEGSEVLVALDPRLATVFAEIISDWIESNFVDF